MLTVLGGGRTFRVIEAALPAIPRLARGGCRPAVRRADAVRIFGGRSDYVQQDHRATIAAYFPHVQYAEVPEAGHWVHAERLDDFLAALTPFLG